MHTDILEPFTQADLRYTECGETCWEPEHKIMAKHIERRFNKWFAVLDIPVDIRPQLGNKRRYFKTCGTSSETVAARKAAVLVRGWRLEIEQARRLVANPFDSNVDWTRRVLAELARDTDTENADGVRSALIDKMQDLDRQHPGMGEAVWQRATGATTGTTDHLDDFLSAAIDGAKGRDAKRRDVERLAREMPNLSDITRPAVRKWVDDLAKIEHFKRATIVRLLSSCRMFWGHLQTYGIVPDDLEPFNKLRLPGGKGGGGSGKNDKPVAFKCEEVARLLEAAKAKGNDQPLVDLISLAMWTGARIEEICSLKVADVDLAGNTFDIITSKTGAGIRTVPIHAALRATMVRLCTDSADDYVLSGLPANHYGERRGAIGQRFGTLKAGLGFRADVHVFHGLRKTVITEMLNADVPLETVRAIVGHGQKGVTAKDYYKGPKPAMKAEAIGKLTYPADA